MKLTFTALSLLFSISASANIFSDIRDGFIEEFASISVKVENDVLAASTACIQVAEDEKFTATTDLVDACNTLDTFEEFTCAETLFTRYNKYISQSIIACSRVSNKNSLKVLKRYAYGNDGNPLTSYREVLSPTNIIRIAAANTESEATCIINYMNLGSFSFSNVEKKCIDDTPIQLDRVTYETLGFVNHPRTAQYTIRSLGTVLGSALQSIGGMVVDGWAQVGKIGSEKIEHILD